MQCRAIVEWHGKPSSLRPADSLSFPANAVTTDSSPLIRRQEVHVDFEDQRGHAGPVDVVGADGSWDVPGGTAENAGVVGPNNIYWTGMASLILEVYMHFLPAYQR